MNYLFFITVLIFGEIANSQKTILDLKFSPLLKLSRKILNTVAAPQNFSRALESNKRSNKVQFQFPENSTFFCDVQAAGARSKNVPKSVHQLRPADIDIVNILPEN